MQQGTAAALQSFCALRLLPQGKMNFMFGARYTVISALLLGLGAMQHYSGPLRADDAAPISRRNSLFNSVIGEQGVHHAAYVWPENRQVLPNPFAGETRQISFLESEPISEAYDESELSVGASEDENDVETSGNEEPNLSARVRELEKELAELTGSDDSAPGELVTARLDRLEESLGDVESDGAQFMETLSNNSRRIFNGRIHLDTWQYPVASRGINAIESGDFQTDPENRTLIRRARIGIRGTVPPDNMSYRLELEFSGKDGGRIRDAWLGWDDLPMLQTLRIGNQKRPYGLDQVNSSNVMTFLERPYIVDAFNRGSRRIGIASYGGSPNLAWNWQTGLFNMVQIQDTNDIVGDVAQMELAGRLANTWWYDESSDGRGYGHFAMAGTFAYPDGQGEANEARFRSEPESESASDWLDTGQIEGANGYQLLAAEAVFNVGALQLIGEWMNLWLQRDVGSGSDVFLNGGYVSLSYFLTGEHIPWNRKLGVLGRVQPIENFFCVNAVDGSRGSGLGAWQVALRLSRADFSDRDVRGGVSESATIALNWYWNAHTRLQWNYIFGQIDDRRTTLNSGATPIVSGDYQILGTRFMIDF